MPKGRGTKEQVRVLYELLHRTGPMSYDKISETLVKRYGVGAADAYRKRCGVAWDAKLTDDGKAIAWREWMAWVLNTAKMSKYILADGEIYRHNPDKPPLIFRSVIVSSLAKWTPEDDAQVTGSQHMRGAQLITDTNERLNSNRRITGEDRVLLTRWVDHERTRPV